MSNICVTSENNTPRKKGLKRTFSKQHSQEEIQPNITNKKLKLDNEKLSVMIDKLNCPVCFDLPRPGQIIYGCRNGHHVCQKCQKSIAKCPMCRDTEIKCRQLMLEEVMKTIVFTNLNIINMSLLFNQLMETTQP